VNCHEVQENLWEYHHSQLAADLVSVINRHVSHCQSCALQSKSFRQVEHELDRVDEIEPSLCFDQRLNAKLEELEKREQMKVLKTLRRHGEFL
jgi:hypothetical protein